MDTRGPEVLAGTSTPQHAFGYFLSCIDSPYEPAPAPPPGPALLDDNESNMLDNFFTTLNSNHLDTTDFWMGGHQNKSMGTAFNFEWADELPPTFKGSTTSLSQPLPRHTLDGKNSFGLLNSDDVVAATSVIYSNDGAHGDFGSSMAHQHFLGPAVSGAYKYCSGKQTKNAQQTSHDAPKDSRMSVPRGFHAPEMLFDEHRPSLADQQAKKIRTLQWGSDISFMNQVYVPPPDSGDETSHLLEYMRCLEPQASVPNTRQPSPERPSSPRASHSAWNISNDTTRIHRSRVENENQEDDGTQPRKRQKLSLKREDDEDSDTSSPRPRRKSQSSNTIKARRASNDASSRKSRQSNSVKPARENLTEEQKRTNHILSEQKRRNLIRQGFDELCSLVPGLKGGGFSKSAMLIQTADWLEEVLRGNEMLREQLAEMKTMNGLVMPR
ncbi:hypothetical protein MPDQ_004662 [Monascus purpureus]|uniref:BHLH domain-containing protein n=1 Tax=Monascus purpureus TaxID=5098 RepID=A0A507QXJ5_MONPU|nr:hypothetical protein MPDQ_004662 [Monascus purpureus]BDD60756.1 hypothetical protein MAP00_005855 [Monascus purpureus]